STGRTRERATALQNQLPMCESTASEYSRSLPIFDTSTFIGTLPGRKPGTFTRPARSCVACSIAWLTSPAGTSTVSLTRSSASCSTWACIGGSFCPNGLAWRLVELEAAIRSRRSHKRFGSEPVPPEVVAELLDLARWAPNHHLTEPW